MILLDYRGGGATRKTGSCCGLDLCHSEDKDNSSPKIEEFYEKMKRHSGLAAKSVETESKRDFMPLPGDPESINADKDRLRLGGRSDEGSRTPCTTFRHSDESQSLSMPVNSIRYFWQQKSRKAAFTMAEVLITLGIIGIVAAMTLPSLIGKYQKKVTVTRLKRTYTVLSQAVQRSIADNGDPSGWGLEGFYNTAPTDENLQKFIETFSKTYIVPYLAKINKIEFGTFKDLGYKDIKYNGSGFTSEQMLNVKGQMLILNDGTVLQIRMTTYNYGTEEDRDDKFQNIYITVDINGFSGPNTVGKDIFMFYVESLTGKFDFYGYPLKDITRQQVYSRCKSESNTCGRLILMDGWEIKDDYPW